MITASKDRPLLDKSGKDIVFSLRIDEAVYETIKRVAENEKRSINSQLLLYIENGLIEQLEEQED